MNTEEDKQNEKRHDSTGRSPMLTVIFKDKRRMSLAYAYLLEASLSESSEGDRIELNFGFVQLIIDGLRLETIYRKISLHHADELVVVGPEESSPSRASIHSVKPLRPESES
jgi:hypothetical protein